MTDNSSASQAPPERQPQPEPHGPDDALLFELSLAIGGTFNKAAMLQTAVDAFLRKLACSSASVFAAPGHGDPTIPAYAIPHEAQRNQATELARQRLAGCDRTQWPQVVAGLPEHGVGEDGGHYYQLPIGVVGLLVLVRHGSPLPPAVVAALPPLTAKLAEAWHACQQNEELATSHRSTVLERNMLRALIEGTPTIVFALDPEGRFVVSEGRGLQSLGREPREAVGDSIFDIYAHVPKIVESVRAALAGQQRHVTVQIDSRSFDAMYTPVIDEHGVVTGVVGVAHDVTDRRAAVETLSAVLNTVGESILTLDAAGNIVMVNQALERLFGYKQAELLGQHLARLVPGTRVPEQGSLAAWLDAETPSGLGRRLQMEGQEKHGRRFPVEICINEMFIGDERYYTGSIRDLSDQMEYDRLRDEFVGTVSHELRTPLASIMGWTETLLTGHPGPLNDQQRRFLEIIYGSSQRLNRLIEEILTVSRIQRGTLRLNREPVYPSQIFALLRDTIGKVAERQQVQVQIEDSWPAETPVIGDANLLEQTLANLLSNAVKFSPAGSSVQVHSMAVHGAWRVEVVDHGMGIPEADMPRLFQRFMRGSNARQAQIQGTGLGLYVSRAIIQGHGGELNLTSHEGVGTTVWFEIPGQT